jgi:hypothetical protein
MITSVFVFVDIFISFAASRRLHLAVGFSPQFAA